MTVKWPALGISDAAGVSCLMFSLIVVTSNIGLSHKLAQFSAGGDHHHNAPAFEKFMANIARKFISAQSFSSLVREHKHSARDQH